MKIGEFLRQARAMFLTCTVVPVVLGGAIAWYDTGSFNWLMFGLTLLGVSVAHIGVNLSNDYFDFNQGADKAWDETRPYSGGGDALTRDQVEPRKVKLWFWGSFVVAGLIGLLIIALAEKGRGLIALLAFFGFLGGYFYTAPPLKLAYRGLGELDIFVFLGPAPVLGTYAVQTGTISLSAWIASLPAAGLIGALLWINEYTDYETDKEAGKNNMVVLLGRKKARWGFALLTLFIFVSILVPVIMGMFPAVYLVAFLPLPLAIRSVATALKHYGDSQQIKLAQADFLKVHLFVGLLCSVGLGVGTVL